MPVIWNVWSKMSSMTSLLAKAEITPPIGRPDCMRYSSPSLVSKKFTSFNRKANIFNTNAELRSKISLNLWISLCMIWMTVSGDMFVYMDMTSKLISWSSGPTMIESTSCLNVLMHCMCRCDGGKMLVSMELKAFPSV